MHRARGKQTPAKAFRRLVLMNEDEYNRALQCMEEDAVLRMGKRTQWYEKSVDTGHVVRDYSFRGATPTERSVPPSQVPLAHTPTTRTSMPSTSTADRHLPVTEPELDYEGAEAEAEARAKAARAEEADKEVQHSEPHDVQSDLRLPTSNRKDIPATYLKKYDALFKKLRQSKLFQVDASGRVALGDAPPIAGSNFHKLMRSVFVSSFVSDRTVGRREFLNALKDSGVRASEVSSQSAITALAPQGGSGALRRKVRKGPPGQRERILRVY